MTSAPAGLKVWDTTSWRQVAELPGRAGTLCFSPDGRILGCAQRGRHIEVDLGELATPPGEMHRHVPCQR